MSYGAAGAVEFTYVIGHADGIALFVGDEISAYRDAAFYVGSVSGEIAEGYDVEVFDRAKDMCEFGSASPEDAAGFLFFRLFGDRRGSGISFAETAKRFRIVVIVGIRICESYDFRPTARLG